MVFLMNSAAPDIIFHPCDAFTVHNASPAMARDMPHMPIKEEVQKLLDMLKVLCPSLCCKQLLENELSSPHLSTSAIGASTSTCFPVIRNYCDNFGNLHNRKFRWLPLAGYGNTHPSVLSAHCLANTLNIDKPTRQEITRHECFQALYNDRAEDTFSSSTHCSKLFDNTSPVSPNDKTFPLS
uniref:Cyclic nucleotide-gated cation channel beta-3 n=1 Tax=Lygus hesperus TaxID=30085 RepID=A0A0A9Y949_LYGHE